MTSASRAYHSPLRDEQAQATRDRILAAALTLMQAGDDVTMQQIALEAGLERRTVFRHFASRDALLAAAFQWLNDQIGTDLAPADPSGLTAAIRTAFARMDAHDGPIRAALHSKAGRDMRALNLPGRRSSFAASLAPVTRRLSAGDRARIEALAHLLYSASAWEVLKDYGGLNGADAGEAAAWALELVLAAAERLPREPGAAQAPENTED